MKPKDRLNSLLKNRQKAVAKHHQEVKLRIFDYIKKTNGLYDSIHLWLAPWTIEEKIVLRTELKRMEEVGTTYDINILHLEIPSLLVKIQFNPRGCNIATTTGIVDMICNSHSKTLILDTSLEWQLHEHKKQIELTEDVFLDQLCNFIYLN